MKEKAVRKGCNADPKVTRKIWVEKNKENLREWWRVYREKNRGKMNIQNAMERDRLKKEVYSHYSVGGKVQCVGCGFEDIDCLQLDHVNDDGSSERKKLFGSRSSAGTISFRYLRRHNYPPGLQVLCANCNWKKELVRKRKKLYDDNSSVQLDAKKVPATALSSCG